MVERQIGWLEPNDLSSFLISHGMLVNCRDNIDTLFVGLTLRLPDVTSFAPARAINCIDFLAHFCLS